MLKITRSRHRLIFNMGIPTPWRDDLYIETGPSWQTRASWSYKFNTSAADVLGTQGATASTAIVLTKSARNIKFSIPNG